MKQNPLGTYNIARFLRDCWQKKPLVLRGIAFREKGFFDASLECLKQSVAKRSRSEGILNRGLWERSFTYERMGKVALAKKDLEKIDKNTNTLENDYDIL